MDQAQNRGKQGPRLSRRRPPTTARNAFRHAVPPALLATAVFAVPFHCAVVYGPDTGLFGWLTDLRRASPFYLYLPAHLLMGFSAVVAARWRGCALTPVGWAALAAALIGFEVVLWMLIATDFDLKIGRELPRITPRILSLVACGALGGWLGALPRLDPTESAAPQPPMPGEPPPQVPD